jgi:hypothetical protein
MEQKVFNTFVRTSNVKDDYIECTVGNIARVLAGVCGKTEDVIHKVAVTHKITDESGVLLTTRCAQADYNRFVEGIEELYPGLCEFDY